MNDKLPEAPKAAGNYVTVKKIGDFIYTSGHVPITDEKKIIGKIPNEISIEEGYDADILFWVISQRILPPVVVVLPVYIMFQRIGLLDTHIAMILTYAVVNLPIVVWLIHDFVLTIPIDLEESAQLDGASRLYIFWDIILPLCKQGLAATTLLILILSWNEYLLASFLSTSKAQTLPIMVSAQITQDRGILWWNMCVVIIIMIIPVITMAFFLQKFITKGVLLGAVKG